MRILPSCQMTLIFMWIYFVFIWAIFCFRANSYTNFRNVYAFLKHLMLVANQFLDTLQMTLNIYIYRERENVFHLYSYPLSEYNLIVM